MKLKLRWPFQRTSSMRILQASAVITLLALALMVWALLDPTPLPVMLAMTAGQGLGTTALALYVFVIIRDIRRSARDKRRDSLNPPLGAPGKVTLPGTPAAASDAAASAPGADPPREEAT